MLVFQGYISSDIRGITLFFRNSPVHENADFHFNCSLFMRSSQSASKSLQQQEPYRCAFTFYVYCVGHGVCCQCFKLSSALLASCNSLFWCDHTWVASQNFSVMEQLFLKESSCLKKKQEFMQKLYVGEFTFLRVLKLSLLRVECVSL